MCEKITLNDFSEESQLLLRKFGVTDEVDIGQRIKNFLERNNINLKQYVEEVSVYMLRLEMEEELSGCKKHHRKRIFKHEFPLADGKIFISDENELLAS